MPRTAQTGSSRRPGPDTAALQAVVDHLGHIIANGKREQAKALLAILIAELQVNSRSKILPTYRLGTPAVCTPTSSSGGC